ncbi:MAG: CSLREA domain-containing protein, partial [Gammaproteobacteria bacterium]
MKFPAFPARHPSLFLVLLATLMAPVVHAATITVNTFDDEINAGDGLCSLREAVMSVNAGADVGDCQADVTTDAYGFNDTIILDTGTYTLSLPGLDEGYTGTGTQADPFVVTNTPDASMGDLDLMHSVRIIGAGSALTKIEWDPAVATSITTADRIFHIYTDNAGTSNDDVVIEGVTLAYGKTFEEYIGVDPQDATLEDYFRRAGGAIALGAGANVVKINPTLEGAENANAGGLGGSTGGESGTTDYTLTLNGVVVEDSSAQGDGGGLYLAAPTTATNLVVRNNRSTTNGGGIYNEANTSISQATFSGNIAEGGGGIFTTGSNIVKITRSTFTANRAIGGGAISNRKGV